MAIAVVAHTSGRSSDGNGFTTGAIDTSGANFLIISISTAATGDTVSDSKSNTWTSLTENAGLFVDRWQRFFYAKNATVGSGHTFTVSGNSSFPSMFVAACSGVDTTAPFDSENTANDFNNTVHAGSLTPGTDNEILFAALEYDDDSSDPTIDLSYTISDLQRLDGGKAVGGALAYLIETTATTKNPAFTWTNGGRCVGGAACFKAAAGGGGPITLSADKGTFTESGQVALFRRNSVNNKGTFTETGQAALFRVSELSSKGTFTESGKVALFRINEVVNKGTFTLTGQSVADAGTITTLTADKGIFTEVGKAAGYVIRMSAGTGSCTLTGKTAILTSQVSHTKGTFTETGRAALFNIVERFNKGSFAFAGQDAILTDTGAAPVLSEIILRRRRRMR